MISIVALLLVGLVSVRGDAVAFSAALSHDLTVSSKTNIIYDEVITNVGAGYNPSTGVFTAPQSGIYLFQFHSLAEVGAQGWLELYQNSNYIASTYAHSSDYASAGNSVILDVKQNDMITIKAVENVGNSVLYGVAGDEIYNTFSGYLLAPEQTPAGRK